MGGAGARANHCRKPRFLLLPPRIDPPPTAAPPPPSVLHTRRPPHRNRRKVPGPPPPPPPSGPRAIYNAVRITVRREFAYCARIYVCTYYYILYAYTVYSVRACVYETYAPLRKKNAQTIYAARAYEVSAMGGGGGE